MASSESKSKVKVASSDPTGILIFAHSREAGPLYGVGRAGGVMWKLRGRARASGGCGQCDCRLAAVGVLDRLHEEGFHDREAASAAASGPASSSDLAQRAGSLRHALADVPIRHGLALADDHARSPDSGPQIHPSKLKMMFKVISLGSAKKFKTGPDRMRHAPGRSSRRRARRGPR